jgi:hypothetical protein
MCDDIAYRPSGACCNRAESRIFVEVEQDRAQAFLDLGVRLKQISNQIWDLARNDPSQTIKPDEDRYPVDGAAKIAAPLKRS